MSTLAADFVASDKSWLQIADGDQSGLDVGTSHVCISLFAYFSSLSTYQTLIQKPSDGYHLYTRSNGTLYFLFGSILVSTDAGVLTTGKHISIIVVADRNGDCVIYVDNVEKARVDISSLSATNIQSSAAFTVGSTGTPAYGYWHDGRLGYLRLWKDHVLTPSEIARQANMSGGTPYARPYALFTTAEKVGLVSAWDEAPAGGFSSGVDWEDLHGSNDLSFAAANIISPTTLNGGFETPGPGRYSDDVPSAIGSGQSRVFDGVDDYIAAAFGDVITSKLTVSMWINPTSVASLQYPIALGNSGTLRFGVYINFAQVGLYDGVNQTIFGGGPLPTETWQHVFIEYDASGSPRGKLWVNNVLRSTVQDDISGNIASQNQINIGRRVDGWWKFGGLLDDVRVYSDTLTADQRATLAAGGDVAGAVGHWPFDGTLLDTSGNGNHGTEYGYGADVFANWTETAQGSSTVNDETVDVYSGAHSCRLDIDGSSSYADVRQTSLLTVDKTYGWSYRAKSLPSGKTVYLPYMSGQPGRTLSAAYAEYSGAHEATSATFAIARASAPSASIYLDNVTLTAAEILTAEGPGVVSYPDTGCIEQQFIHPSAAYQFVR